MNEDWAIESMAGDVFLLGTHSWRIRRVESGIVRVTDAQGAPPSIPFWLGEAPARTRRALARGLRAARGGERQLEDDGREATLAWLERECAARRRAARTSCCALRRRAAGAPVGFVPTCDELVAERFFDEAGGMQLVIHSPFGGRINRALRARAAQALLPRVQLRAAGRARPTTRSSSRSAARSTLRRSSSCRASALAHGRRGAGAGAARLADVHRALALERDPLARGAALARQGPRAVPDPAHAVRRPARRRVPEPGRVSGERHLSDRDARPPARRDRPCATA